MLILFSKKIIQVKQVEGVLCGGMCYTKAKIVRAYRLAIISAEAVNYHAPQVGLEHQQIVRKISILLPINQSRSLQQSGSRR